MVGMIGIRSQVVNIFILFLANTTDRENIHLLVARVGGEDHTPMGLVLAQKYRSERFPVNTSRHIPARKINESGKNIHPADHGTGSGIRFNFPGPADLQGHPCSIVVEIPLSERPLPAMITGKEKDKIVPKLFLGKS